MAVASPTLLERVQFGVASFLFGLPTPVKRLLAGGQSVQIDGQELDADAQLMLRLLALIGHRSLDGLTPAAAREDIHRSSRVLAGAPLPVDRVIDVAVPGPSGTMAGRLYVPGTEVPGLLVYYHGGGWVVGDLDTHDVVARQLARDAGLGVLSISYRRAPEHRFPAAVEDAYAAFMWAVGHATSLGLGPARVGVGGDSAGGTLAAVVSHLAVGTGGPVPAVQLLIYPVTDLSTKHPSYALFREGFFLTEAEMDWYRAHYLGDHDGRDPRASPLLAEDLTGLPPAVVVTAGFDVLRDEGEAYARRLEAAGVAVRATRHRGLIHGFANVAAVSATARAAMYDAATDLRRLLVTR
jgi:acetyl esterase